MTNADYCELFKLEVFVTYRYVGEYGDPYDRPESHVGFVDGHQVDDMGRPLSRYGHQAYDNDYAFSYN